MAHRQEGVKIEDRLLDHAKRQEALRKQKLQEENSKKHSSVTNASSLKYIIQKFRREFIPTYRRVLELPEEPTEEENKKINYIRLKDLLVALGMLNEHSATSESQERILMYDMWRTLFGEERQEVAIEDVYVFLLVILRMPDHKRIGVSPSEGDKVHEVDGEQEPGFLNQDHRICFKLEDVPKI